MGLLNSLAPDLLAGAGGMNYQDLSFMLTASLFESRYRTGEPEIVRDAVSIPNVYYRIAF